MSTTEADAEYDVETIVRHRKRNGKMEYLVKWKGYSSDLNTWEPAKHFSDIDVLREYHEERKLNEIYRANYVKKAKLQANPRNQTFRKRNVSENDFTTSESEDEHNKKYKIFKKFKMENLHEEFEDFEAEKVVEVNLVKNTGELVCLVKWKYEEKMNYVSIEEAHRRFPQLLIAFYENRIFWETTNGIKKMNLKTTSKDHQNN